LDNGIETLQRLVMGHMLLRLGGQDVGEGEIVGLVRHGFAAPGLAGRAPGVVSFTENPRRHK